MRLKEGRIKPAFAETLAFCGIESSRWLRIQNYAYQSKRPGVKKARAIVKRIQTIHRLKLELDRLCKFS